MKTIFALTVVCLLAVSSAMAAEPVTVSYQGSLLLSTGQPVPDGSYDMRFRIFDAAVGGAQLWAETDAAVETTGGLFATILGDTSSFAAILNTGASLWLEVSVDLGGNGAFEAPEVYLPRQPVVGAPSAVDAHKLNGLVAAEYQRRVTGTAPAGSFLTGINADGTVVTALDQNSGGDITGVTAGAGLTGGGASGDVALAADPTYLQRRVTGAAPAGSFLTGINADGTVVTALDQNSGGDITAVTAGAGLTGGGASGAVALAVAPGVYVQRAGDTMTGILTVNPSGTGTHIDVGVGDIIGISELKFAPNTPLPNFHLGNRIVFGTPHTCYLSIGYEELVRQDETRPEVAIRSWLNGWTYVGGVPGDPPALELQAGVHLPSGAVVTDFRCWVKDDDTDGSIVCRLSRHPKESGGYQDMAVANTTFLDANANVRELVDSAITNSTIQNSAYIYMVRVSLNPSVADNRVAICSFLITYEMAEVHW